MSEQVAKKRLWWIWSSSAAVFGRSRHHMGVTRFGNLFTEDWGAKEWTLLYWLFGLDMRGYGDVPQAILSHLRYMKCIFPEPRWSDSLQLGFRASQMLLLWEGIWHPAIPTNTTQLFGGRALETQTHGNLSVLRWLIAHESTSRTRKDAPNVAVLHLSIRAEMFMTQCNSCICKNE